MASLSPSQADLEDKQKQLLDRLLANLRNIRYTWGESSVQFQDAVEMMQKVSARVEGTARDVELERLMGRVKLDESDDQLK